MLNDSTQNHIVIPQWRKTVGAVVVYCGLASGLALGGAWFYLFYYFDTSEMSEPNKMSFLIQIGVPILIAYSVSKLFFWIWNLVNPTMGRNFPFNAPKKTKWD
jgi:hypothetical protein